MTAADSCADLIRRCKEVLRLTEGRQLPTVRRENLRFDFTLEPGHR